MSIIAAVDRDEPTDRVVDEGRAIADAFGSDLHIVHVLSRSEFVGLERTSVDESGEAVDLETVREYAKSIAEQVSREQDTSVGLVGDISGELIRYAEENDAQYLVIGGRRRSPVGKALFGSVTQKVLLSAPMPVVTVMDRNN